MLFQFSDQFHALNKFDGALIYYLSYFGILSNAKRKYKHISLWNIAHSAHKMQFTLIY